MGIGGIGVTAGAGQIVLTVGTSQAIEFAIRHLFEAGGAALSTTPDIRISSPIEGCNALSS